MDFEEEFELEHLLFKERRCRSCGIKKDLSTDFYKIRKGRPTVSSYSYECKECTKKRVILSRMTTAIFDRWEYPDW